MILAVDIGNSNILVGGFEGEEPIFTARLSTDPKGTEDEYAAKLAGIFQIRGVDPASVTGAILSSVVPPLNRSMVRAVEYFCGVKPLVVGPGVKTGLNIRCDAPSSVGSDMICACVAVLNRYGAPALIADLGTATKLIVLDSAGCFTGVSICPGVTMGLNALAEQTAQLPKVSLESPRWTVGKNTADSMRSGVILGHAAMIDGMIDRIREETGTDLPVYATGGMASLVTAHCRRSVTLDETLVLRGLYLLYQKNN